MGKQKSFLLVGLPHTGIPLLTAALEQHREALAGYGVRVPAKSADEAFRAAVELRREHKAWGLRRRDVEGAWAGICRRALKQDSTAVVGHELLAGAAPDEIALLVDGLAGTRIHVVVLAGVPDGRVGLFPDELDLAGVLTRWELAATGPDRVHVVVSDPSDPAVAWRALGAVAGFDAERLPLPAPATAVNAADTASLRLIAESSGVHVDHDELVELAEEWGKVVADRGYDVLGDLRDLVPVRPAGPTDPARASYDDRVDILNNALSEAVAEVGRLRQELALARERTAKPEKKRGEPGRSRLSAAARRPRRRSAR
jgi:hypothetical protein